MIAGSGTSKTSDVSKSMYLVMRFTIGEYFRGPLKV